MVNILISLRKIVNEWSKVTTREAESTVFVISAQWRAFSTQFWLTLLQESLTHSRGLLEDLRYYYYYYYITVFAILCYYTNNYINWNSIWTPCTGLQ